MGSQSPSDKEGKSPFYVEIKESAVEDNKPIRRMKYRNGSILAFESRAQAEIEVTHLSHVGERDLRIQATAPNDSTPADAYLIPTGRSRRGYGRTTENASSRWAKKRKEAIERDDFTCQECNAEGGPTGEVQLHVDHVTPKYAGGTDDLSNLRTLCKECHLEKHGSNPRSEYRTDDEIATAVTRRAESSQYPVFTVFDLKKELEIGSNATKRLRRVMRDLERWGDWGVLKGEYNTVYFKREGWIDEDAIGARGNRATYQNYLLEGGTAKRRLNDEESTSLSDFAE